MKEDNKLARPKVPTIPDDKIDFFREQLYRELSHMFEWDGLPTTVPHDYLERNLIRYGYLLYYEDERIGQDVLRATVLGRNRHDLPVTARTYVRTTVQEPMPQIERNIKYLTDSEDVTEDFDPKKDGVLITNMAFGEDMREIVEHFAKRLALAQQSFDTQLLWTNLPYIFVVSDKDTKLSVETMFSKLYSGEPFTIEDAAMFSANAERAGVPTNIKYLGKEIMDTQNEIMMKFKQTVGFDTAGVDKAERTNTLEIESNNQHTQTVLQVMLSQREKAVEAINAFFGQNMSVQLTGQDDQEDILLDEEDDDGTGDDGTKGLAND